MSIHYYLKLSVPTEGFISNGLEDDEEIVHQHINSRINVVLDCVRVRNVDNPHDNNVFQFSIIVHFLQQVANNLKYFFFNKILPLMIVFA